MSIINNIPKKYFYLCCATAAVLSAACWGSAWVLTKSALETVPAPTLLVIELIVGNIFLWTLLIARGEHHFTVGEFVKLGLPGLLGLGLSNSVELAGLSLTTASNAALIKSTETILIVAAAWLFLREKQGWLIFFFGFVSFCGVVLVSSEAGTTGSTTTPNRYGDALILAAAICGAVFYILTKRDSRHHDALRLTALHLAFGLMWAVALWAVEIIRGSNAGVPPISTGGWTLAVIAGVLEYALPYWLFLIAVKTLRGGLAPFFLTLVPVFSIGGGYLFLGERLLAVQWLGATLIFAALVGVTRFTGDNYPPVLKKEPDSRLANPEFLFGSIETKLETAKGK